jgi:hypothetical protein
MELQGLYFLLVVGGIALLVWFAFREQQARIRKQEAYIEQLSAQNRQLVEQRDEVGAKLNRVVAAMDEVTKEQVKARLFRSRPHPNPPPGVFPAIERMLAQDSHATVDEFALGWEITNDNPGVVSLVLRDNSPYRSGHIAITGESGYGKSGLAFFILAQLCLRMTTSQLRILCIDGKREAALWQGKAHNWRNPVLGTNPTEIAAAMALVRREREQRERLRERHGVLLFEELPDQVRPPYLLVYVAELDVLKLGTNDLDGWLITEMGTARASGIRFLIETQNNSGRETAWRTHIGTYLAGFQATQDAVKPNIGMAPGEIRALGAVPPHELKGPNYFTLRNGRDVHTLHVPRMYTAERREVLARLPEGVVPSVLDTDGMLLHNGSVVQAEPPKKRSVVVTPEERTAIIAAAARFPSRRRVCMEVFRSTGGDNYEKVKLVCDEEQLLIVDSTPQMIDSL